MRPVTKEMTIKELKETLAPAEHITRETFDPRAGVCKFGLDTDGMMRFFTPHRKQGFQLTEEAYTRFGQMVGIPGQYIKKTPHPIMVPHVNYWMANRGLAQITYAAEGGIIELFSKGALEPISNELVLSACEKTMGGKLKVYHFSHDFFSTVFSVVTEERQEQVKVGEVVRVGVTVENSYALTIPLTLSVYVHRLSCSNGSISATNVFRFSHKGGDGDGTEDWVYQAVDDAWKVADAEVARLKAMTKIKLDDHLSDNMISIFSEFGVPLKVRDDITNMVVDQRAQTLFDLYNIITWMGSNDEAVLADSTVSNRLMRIGGRIAAHPDMCPHCHRVMLN